MIEFFVSAVAEGKDTWNGAGDRGDAAMIAYGAARYALAKADKKEAQELWPLIEYTSDTQTVDNLGLKLNYYYDGTKLPEIIRTIGISNVETKLLVPNVAKISKDEIGRVKAEDLVQNRSDVQNAIYESLKKTLEPQGVIVTAFAIENLAFEDAFEQSIQAKVIAAQDALKMQNKTAEREEEAKQKVIAAQAEADSQKIKEIGRASCRERV